VTGRNSREDASFLPRAIFLEGGSFKSVFVFDEAISTFLRVFENNLHDSMIRKRA
jgi:hypothetical protein